MFLHGAVFGVRFRRRTGAVSLALQRFFAMLVKHAIQSWRNHLVTLGQLLVPVVSAVIGLSAMIYLYPKPIDPPPLPLSLNNYNGPAVPFSADGSGSVPGAVAQKLAEYYAALAGLHGQPVDVGGSNMDDYLLDIADHSLADYRWRYFVAATANDTRLTGFFNNFALHSIAVSLSLADNAVLRYAVPGKNRIETINHPLPRIVYASVIDDDIYGFYMGHTFPFFVCMGMGLIIGTFAMFVVEQRAKKAKHSQFVSGVDVAGFWLAALIWDLLVFAVQSVLLLVVVLSFQIYCYSEWPVFGCVHFAVIVTTRRCTSAVYASAMCSFD